MLLQSERPALWDVVAEYAQPEPLSDGSEPEQRVVISGIGWERHLELDAALGDDRPNPRFYFLDGDLEIMSTSEEHERIKKRIANCMDIFFEEEGMEESARGQATMRVVKQAGAEPDASWSLKAQSEFPDIVLEIALTSGGLPKLAIYGRFPVPEVWIWRRGRLEVHGWSATAKRYERLASSRLLPTLPILAIEAMVTEPSVKKARRDFRTALTL